MSSVSAWILCLWPGPDEDKDIFTGKDKEVRKGLGHSELPEFCLPLILRTEIAHPQLGKSLRECTL
jgi:hypothetical protein